MKKLRIKCNGKQGTCNNFIKGDFQSFNDLAKDNDWQAVGKGWTCKDCQNGQKEKRIEKPKPERMKMFKESLINEE